MPATEVTVALDWTPNANHVGEAHAEANVSLPVPAPALRCPLCAKALAWVLPDSSALPNTGLYVANSKGFYADAGLDVKLAVPDPDYSTTPASKVCAPRASCSPTARNVTHSHIRLQADVKWCFCRLVLSS